jgi:GDP-L-fucose synthase
MKPSKKSRILVTGGSGFVGKKVIEKLSNLGYKNILAFSSKDYDLRDFIKCSELVQQADVVVHLAAIVGGIGFNRSYPATLFHDNLIMGLNILRASSEAKIKKFIGVGTVCAYPKYTPTPFKEENLWDGYPEETNAPYGLAKKMLLVGSSAYRAQHGLNSIFLIPVNIYGPGDSFDPSRSHVIPALIRKIYKAKKEKQKSVTVWGTGIASREFIYIDDIAEGIVLAMEKYNKPDPINLGTGKEILISELVRLIARELDFEGEILWDKSKPDGQPRRLLNVDKAKKEFGFVAKMPFHEGIRKTIQWYVSHTQSSKFLLK